jgi:hypothetical protein
MFHPPRPNLFFKEITFAKKRIIKIINQANIYLMAPCRWTSREVHWRGRVFANLVI